jgi:hypothetical protein
MIFIRNTTLALYCVLCVVKNEKQKPTTPSEQRSKDKIMHLPITLLSCYRHFNKLKVARLSYHRFTASGIIKHFLITTVVKCSLEYLISRLFIWYLLCFDWMILEFKHRAQKFMTIRHWRLHNNDYLNKRPSWAWSYGSWIYNYMCNQCLSPLKLWVRTPFMARCTRYNIMW